MKLLSICALLCSAVTLPVFAQGTTFTYRGLLNDGSTPFTGSAEFQPTLWGSPSGGSAVASNSPTVVIVGVTNGLFVLPLNFGANFPGADRWLQLEVRTTIGPFTTLAPRQQLTPTPYAITASNVTGTLPAAQLTGPIASANLSGAYGAALTMTNPANVLSGTFTGNGANVANVNALTLGGLASSNFWKLGGNAGANPTNGNFLGTTDNQPLEFKVNGLRAARIEPGANGAPNVIAGSPENFVAPGVYGATIAGGSAAYLPVDANSVHADFGAIPGGVNNTVSGYSAVAMGGYTTASGNYAIAMGASTTASGYGSTSMGSETSAAGDISTAMGAETSADGNYSLAAGRRAKARFNGCFVWADSTSADFASTASNQFLIRATGGVGIGAANPNAQLHINGDGVDPSLRVQVNGNSKLVVNANGGTAVGANTTPPTNGLYVSGDVGIGRLPAVNTLELNGSASKTTAGSWLANSDIRIKQSVETVSNALDILNKVRLVSFRYTEGYRSEHKAIEDRRYLNVVAQEFREVFPEHVKSSGEKLPDGSDILQVDIHPLTIYSAAAVQELNAKLNSQTREMTDRVSKAESHLSAKETEIAELKQRIDALEKAIRASTPMSTGFRSDCCRPGANNDRAVSVQGAARVKSD